MEGRTNLRARTYARPVVEIATLAIGLAVVLLIVKAMLLPWEVSSVGEAIRWCLRLALVFSPDALFVGVLTTISLLLVGFCRVHPRVQMWWRPTVFGAFYVSGLYTVLSAKMFHATLMPFTVRVFSLMGDPIVMRSSISRYVNLSSVTLLVVVPLVLVFLPRVLERSRWLQQLSQVSNRRWSVALGLLAMLLTLAYTSLSHAYIVSHWQDPNRWERRIAHNPHTELLVSCVEELLQDNTFVAPVSKEMASDFRTFTERGALKRDPKMALPAGERPKNVIVVLCESIGAEYVNFDPAQKKTKNGAPNTMPWLAKYAAENGVVFENFYVQAPNSCKSLLSLSSSLYPRPDRHRMMRGPVELQVPLLPDVLKENGYRTCYIHSGYWSWRNRDAFLKYHGIDALLDAQHMPFTKLDNSWGVDDRVMFQRALDWVDAGGKEQPFFLLAYTIDTHHPYVSPEEPIDFGVKNPNHGRYLNAIRQTDTNMAWLMQQLEERGLADSTLILFTADHGEAFGQHNLSVHGFSTYEPEVHVPLVMLHPSLKNWPRRDKQVRQQIDVAPTVLDMLGIEKPQQWQGQSFLDEQTHDRAYFFSTGYQTKLGVRQGDWKYCYYVDTGFDELFYMPDDPRETKNLAAEHIELCNSLRQRVGALVSYQRRFLLDHSTRRKAEPEDDESYNGEGEDE